MDCSPPVFSVRGDSPGTNTGVGCHALFQGIFPTQESNQALLHCRWILYQLSYQASLYSGHRTGKGQRSFQSQRKAMPKNAQTTSQLHSSHMLEKYCSKFSKPGFNNMWTENLQMFKLVLEKSEKPEIKLPTSAGSSEKQESSRKTPTSALLTTSKPLTVRITTNCGKFWKRWEYQTTWPASWEICMQVRKQQLELDMEQQTGSK